MEKANPRALELGDEAVSPTTWLPVPVPAPISAEGPHTPPAQPGSRVTPRKPEGTQSRARAPGGEISPASALPVCPASSAPTMLQSLLPSHHSRSSCLGYAASPGRKLACLFQAVQLSSLPASPAAGLLGFGGLGAAPCKCRSPIAKTLPCLTPLRAPSRRGRTRASHDLMKRGKATLFLPISQVKKLAPKHCTTRREELCQQPSLRARE